MEAFIHNLNTMHCLHEEQEVYTLSDLRSMSDLKNLSSFEKEAFGKLLSKLYLEDKLTLKDISEELNITEKVLNNMFKYFKIKKRNKTENSQSVKNRMLKKHNVENVMQIPEIKEKCINNQKKNNNGKLGWNNDKQKETMKHKYGCENPMHSDEIKDKMKQNNLKKYGKEYTFQVEEFKDKAKQTNLKKYNSENVLGKNSIIRKNADINDFSNKDNQTKAHQTLKDKYGGSGLGSTEIKNKIENTNLEIYGCKNPGLKVTAGRSKMEDIIVNELKNQMKGVKIEKNVRGLIETNKRLEVDIYLPEFKIGIEVNGDFSHCKNLYLEDVDNETCISKEMIKTKLLDQNNIKLIHIWEEDIRENFNVAFFNMLCKIYKYTIQGGTL